MMIVLTLGRLRASHIRPWKVWLAGQKCDNDLWFASTVYKNHQEAISVLLGFLEATLRRAITSSETVACGRPTSSEFELLRGYIPAIYQMDLVIFGLSFLFIPPFSLPFSIPLSLPLPLSFPLSIKLSCPDDFLCYDQLCLLHMCSGELKGTLLQSATQSLEPSRYCCVVAKASFLRFQIILYALKFNGEIIWSFKCMTSIVIVRTKPWYCEKKSFPVWIIVDILWKLASLSK